MLINFQDFFDAYALRAKVFPGLLVTVYIIFCYSSFFGKITFGDLNWVETIGLGAIIIMAGIYLISSSIRGVGRFVIQRLMFNDEKDMPSMKMLLPDDDSLAPSVKEEVLRAVNQKFGCDLKSMYTLYRESPNYLKKEIVEVISKIREITRDDKLLKEENIAYGFWRNCTGGSLIALIAVFIILGIHYCFYSSFHVTYLPWVATTFLILSICYIFTLSSANSYARKLFRVFLAKAKEN